MPGRVRFVAVVVCLTGVATGCSNPAPKAAAHATSPKPVALSPTQTPSSSVEITVPNLVGRSVQVAKKKLRAVLKECSGACQISIETETSYSLRPPGTVIGVDPAVGSKISSPNVLILTVSQSLARGVATEVANILSKKVTYEVATSKDGYVLECNQSPCQQDAYQVRFGRALIFSSGVSSAKGKTGFNAIKTAVEDYLANLQSEGYRFVLLGIGKVVLGYRLRDWPKFGTFRQPADPLLGAITRPNLKHLSTSP